jgi:F-type H+-transporting ATPase subunit gamma
MQTLERVKHKIETAEDLQSVVKTMKGLAAVSTRQYERAVTSLAAYNHTVEMGLQVVGRARGVSAPPPRADGSLGALIFGSDQGLCGRFNDQIVDTALSTLPALEAKAQQRYVFAVGTRVAARLEEIGEPVMETLTMPASLAGVTPKVQELISHIDTWRAQRRLDRMVLLHHRLLSGSAYAPHLVHLMPFDLTRLESLMAPAWPSRALPTFTMDQERLWAALRRQHLFVSLYRSFVESLASENASRLASMQAAERSVEERLEALRTDFRYQRQHAITAELLDIVAGFEALQGA